MQKNFIRTLGGIKQYSASLYDFIKAFFQAEDNGRIHPQTKGVEAVTALK